MLRLPALVPQLSQKIFNKVVHASITLWTQSRASPSAGGRPQTGALSGHLLRPWLSLTPVISGLLFPKPWPFRSSSQLRPRQPLVRLQILRLRLLDNLHRQLGRGRLLVPIERLQIIPHELLVVARLSLSWDI